MTKTRWLAACAALALAPTARALTADSVSSGDIREADGSTGQDTNTGSGIKTGHIQNGAITGPKLAPAAVGAAQLADGAVGTAQLAEGAVTAAKIAGAIPESKLDVAGIELRVSNVITVSLDGRGDFADPVDAMRSITTASATNPFVVRVMPGVYDLGARALAVRPYVTVVGSGQGATILTGAGGPSQQPEDYFQVGSPTVVAMLHHSTITDLTVRVSPSAGVAACLGVDSDASVIRIHRVTLEAVGGATIRHGFELYGHGYHDVVATDFTIRIEGWPVYIMADSGGELTLDRVDFQEVGCELPVIYVGIAGGTLRMHDARLSFSGPCGQAAWHNAFAYVEASNVTAVATGPGSVGFKNQQYFGNEAQRVVIESSVLSGETGVVNMGGNLSIANSRIEGAVHNDAAWWSTTPLVLRCFGNHDASFGPVTCP